MADAAEGTSHWHSGDGGRGKILATANALSVPGKLSRLNQRIKGVIKMARPPKWVSEANAQCGWLQPLRQYWQQINREERAAVAAERTKRKAKDKKRAKCRCKAYPWPHRPTGGLCRWPDPPLEQYQRKSPTRPYRTRYLGLRRQIARATGLHPIRDRSAVDALMPQAIRLAKQLKQQKSSVKYRNIKITATGVTGSWQTAGPCM